MRKKGYTIVEMLVVMSIIAVLTLLGGTYLMTANRSNRVDSAAEELLSQIRDTQNKSMSVVTNDRLAEENTIPLVWSLHVRSDGFDILSYNLESSVVRPSPASTWEKTTFDEDITVEMAIENGGTTTDGSEYYINYTTPFGKLYVLDLSCGDSGNTCTWVRNQNQTGDYKLTNDSDNLLARDGKVIFTLKSNGKHEKKVILKSNGDSYIE